MAARLITSCLAVALLAGCSVDGLAFRQDDRLQIENLEDRSTIDVPFDLEFSFDGDLGDTGASAFAVLVDWTPPAPGKTLESLLDGDQACRGSDGCPDGYLERNRIVVTTDTSVTLDNVPVGTDRQERRGFHEVTVVLVDDEGRRVGETSAWARFRTEGISR